MKMVEEKDCYVVYTNTNLTDGYGTQYPLCVCWCEATARRKAKKAYVQGSDAPIKKTTLLKRELVNGWEWYGPVDVLSPTDEDKKQQAIMDKKSVAIENARKAGLSDEDIKAIQGEREQKQ